VDLQHTNVHERSCWLRNSNRRYSVVLTSSTEEVSSLSRQASVRLVLVREEGKKESLLCLLFGHQPPLSSTTHIFTAAQMSFTKVQIPPPAISPEIETFISWLHEENITWDKEHISLEYSPQSGFYFRTTAILSANHSLFSLKFNNCLSKYSGDEHPIFGQIFRQWKGFLVASNQDQGKSDGFDSNPQRSLTLEEYHRGIVNVIVMYEKYLNDSSRWAPYLKILPALDDLESRIPTLMDPSVYSLSLYGSTLHEVTIPNHQQSLEKIYRSFIFPLFSELFPPEIVSTSFSFSHFKWSAGIFLSRAILIPDGRGQTVEALCPLLDLMNHRPGTLSNLRNEGRVGNEQLIYSIGRTLQEGEEISLNYGSRSNGDLLSYFGFTLSNNLADVYLMQVPSFSSITPSTSSTPSSFGHNNNHTRSFALYIGCDIPEDLLNFIRQKVFFDENNSLAYPSVDIQTVYIPPPPSSSSLDWLSFDETDDCLSPLCFHSLGSLISLQNESSSLQWLKDYFLNKSSQLITTLQRNQEEEGLHLMMGGAVNGLRDDDEQKKKCLTPRSLFLNDCQVYLQGQVKILEYLSKKVDQMRSSLQSL
jgi:hypothetical protein